MRLRARLADAEETLVAIRSGDVDALVVSGRHGPRVFTLQGAEHAYRLLIESMNEGALTLTPDKLILSANQCFARMVHLPLGQVIGSPFHRFLSAQDREKVRPLVKHAGKSGSRIELSLLAADGSQTPAQLSIRPVAQAGVDSTTIGMVVTDLTEPRRSAELLRTFTHRVMQAQEAERGRVALELHDNIAQLLCAILLRSQALADSLPAREKKCKSEAVQLRDMLGTAANEVERISRNLRPSVLEQLGLAAVLRGTITEFGERTGVPVEVSVELPAARLPAATELVVYRVFQEAMRNVEQHARARHVTVGLTQQGSSVEMVVRDDGIGFNLNRDRSNRKRKDGLGVLGMRERTAYVGGTFTIKSARRAGTEITLRIPLPPEGATAG